MATLTRIEILLLDARRDREAKRDQLAQAVGQIRHRLDRVERTIADHGHVNPLGELQSSALQFDILCAELTAAEQFVVRLEFAAAAS